jgi:hypothetical protein
MTATGASQLKVELDGVVVDFSKKGGLHLTVGNKTLSIVPVGDVESGQLLVFDGRRAGAVGYRRVQGQLVMQSTAPGDEVIAGYYSALSDSERAKLVAVSQRMMQMASAGDTTSDNPHEAVTFGMTARPLTSSTCAEFEIAAVAAFISCPLTFGLGCLGGAAMLFEETQNC